MRIDIEDVHKQYGAFPALRGVDLAVADGELVALLGPSGSGKTTLLRVIAGLEYPQRGRVLFNGRDMAATPVQKRNIGFVFQHYALFRHLRLWENVAFGLKARPRALRPSRAERRARAFDLLGLVQLGGYENRFPSQLSGGQRQRVALARALAIDPAALLLDEPFGALDAKVRRELRRWLRDLHDRTGHTTVFVTHDQEEALELADRVVVMRDGVVEQIGTPEEIFTRPATGFVYGFLGDTNAVDVTVRGGTVHAGSTGPVLLRGVDRGDGPARLYIRPTDLIVRAGDAGDSARPLIAGPLIAGSLIAGPLIAGPLIAGMVTAQRRRLDSLRLEVRLEGSDAVLEVGLHGVGRCGPAPGDRVCLEIGAFGLFDAVPPGAEGG